MKICGIGCGLFFGIILILWGILILLNVLLGIKVPVFRIILAFILIYLGIATLVGKPIGWGKAKNVIICERRKPDTSTTLEKYEIVFGERIVDLTGIKLGSSSKYISVNTVFGECILKINPELPSKLVINAAFAEARLPDGTSFSFGTNTFKTPSFDESKPFLLIEGSVVFGKLELETIKTPETPSTPPPDTSSSKNN